MILPPSNVLGFFPDYRSTQIAWQGLAPVGAWLIEALRPQCIVELGSYRGDSFFAMLEAAKNRPEIKQITAIDSWRGDIHTGPFNDEVFGQFKAEFDRHADPRARVLKQMFNQARVEFDPGSIDLLHIDGAHDYASARADFEGWLPLMKPNGVIVLHDPMVRDDPFGVWKLWAEIVVRFPGRTFKFDHSNGLGVLCLGHVVGNDIQRLCGLAKADQQIVKTLLAEAGEQITGMTRFEAALTEECGGTIAPNHIFARADQLPSLRLAQQNRFRRADDTDISVGSLFAPVETRLAGQLQSGLDERLAGIAHEITDQLGAHLDLNLAQMKSQTERLIAQTFRDGMKPQIAALQKTIEPRLRKSLKSTLDRDLKAGLADQMADFNATLETRLTRLEAAARPRLRKQAQDLIDEAAQEIQLQLDDLVEKSCQKNDAQDDSILYLSEAVAGQAQAIAILKEYVQALYTHPLFK